MSTERRKTHSVKGLSISEVLLGYRKKFVSPETILQESDRCVMKSLAKTSLVFVSAKYSSCSLSLSCKCALRESGCRSVYEPTKE